MTLMNFDPARSDAIREKLVSLAAESNRYPQRRYWILTTAIALAAALGGGVTSAAVALGVRTEVFNPASSPNASAPPSGSGNPGIAAPPGTIPGAPVVSLLGTAVSQTVDGAAEIELNPVAGTTHVRVTVTCLTAGTISWGLSPENNPSSSCDAAASRSRDGSSFDFAVDGPSRLYVSSVDGVQSIVTYQYTAQLETAWGVNQRGETFGVVKPGFGEPDLLLATATNSTVGYVYASELAQADGSAAAAAFNSPEEALEWQESMKGKTITINVYKEDGISVVGQFVVQY